MAINSGTNSEDTSLHLGLQRMKKLRGKRAAVRKIALKTPVFCGGLKAKVLCVPKISDKPGPESPKFVEPNFPGWEELVQPPSGAGRGHPEEGHPPGGSPPPGQSAPTASPHRLHSHPDLSGGLISRSWDPRHHLGPERPGSSARPPPAERSRGPSPTPGILPRCGSAGSSAEPPLPSRSRDHRQLPGTGSPGARLRAAPRRRAPHSRDLPQLPAPESPAVSRDRSAFPIAGPSVASWNPRLLSGCGTPV